MNTMRSCTGSQNISFPLRTNISDISGYYAKIHKDKPNIKATFTPRNTNPNFNDSARVSGAIDESRNSINITYNDIFIYGKWGAMPSPGRFWTVTRSEDL